MAKYMTMEEFSYGNRNSNYDPEVDILLEQRHSSGGMVALLRGRDRRGYFYLATRSTRKVHRFFARYSFTEREEAEAEYHRVLTVEDPGWLRVPRTSITQKDTQRSRVYKFDSAVVAIMTELGKPVRVDTHTIQVSAEVLAGVFGVPVPRVEYASLSFYGDYHPKRYQIRLALEEQPDLTTLIHEMAHHIHYILERKEITEKPGGLRAASHGDIFVGIYIACLSVIYRIDSDKFAKLADRLGVRYVRVWDDLDRYRIPTALAA